MNSKPDIVYLHGNDKRTGLICIRREQNDEIFTFYVYNGEWKGSFYKGLVYIFDTGKYEDERLSVETNIENMPVWAQRYATALINKDKDELKRCQQGYYYQ